MVKERRSGGVGGLPSQTLIVLSQDPDTIVLPSGEKATEATTLLCALVFSLTRSSVAAWEGSRSQQEARKGDAEAIWGPQRT